MNRLLYFLSNTDQDLIVQCDQRSRIQQRVKGLLVLIAGIFVASSAISAGSLLSKPLAIVFGLAFGLMMMFFYRYVVSVRNVGAALLALVFVIGLGVIVSVPMEIQVFEGRIQEELVKERLAQENTEIVRREMEMDDSRRKLEELQRQLIAEFAGTAGSKRFGRAYQERLKIYEDYRNLQQKRVAQLSAEIEQIRSGKLSLNVSHADDLLSRFEALQKIQSTYPTVLKAVWMVRLMLIFTLTLPIFLRLSEGNTKYNELCGKGGTQSLGNAYDRIVPAINSRFAVPDFGYGFASAIDWTGILAPKTEDLGGDAAAIASDWKVVGKDLEKVLTKYGRRHS